MKYVIGVGASLLFTLCANALAATPEVRSLSPKKQLSACMTKQMMASRSISYNAAMKVCLGMLKDDNLIASNGAKPAHAR